MPDIVGAPEELGEYGDLEGIDDDDYIDPDRPEAPDRGIVAAVSVPPASAPVPREYAEKHDKKNPSTTASRFPAPT